MLPSLIILPLPSYQGPPVLYRKTKLLKLLPFAPLVWTGDGLANKDTLHTIESIERKTERALPPGYTPTAWYAGPDFAILGANVRTITPLEGKHIPSFLAEKFPVKKDEPFFIFATHTTNATASAHATITTLYKIKNLITVSQVAVYDKNTKDDIDFNPLLL